MPRPPWFRTALFATALLAVAGRWFLGPHVQDDAYITFRFARNLAAGLGFTFNPPDRVLGTSTPLFTAIMALPALAGVAPAWIALTIATVADLVTIACGVWLLERHGWRVAALLYAAAIAGWPSYLTSTVSGMETSLYIALLSIVWVALAWERYSVVAVAAGLATLCRPDGVIAAAVCGASILARAPRAMVRWIAIVAAVLTPWLLFSAMYFHTLVPASVTAKAHHRLAAVESSNVLAGHFGSGAYGAIDVFAIAGAVVLLRRTGRSFGAPLAWLLIYVTAFAITGAFSHFPWYFTPILPIYFACAAAGVEWAGVTAIGAPRLSRIAVPLALVGAAVLASRLPPHRAQLDRWMQGRERLYERVARERLADPACTLAATEVGAFGYFFEGRILDLVGLVSPEVIGRPVVEVLSNQRPCWVATYSDHIDPAVLVDRDFRAQYDLAFTQSLGPARTFLLFSRRPTVTPAGLMKIP